MLINSQTDQSIKVISSGDTINLADYPAGKLNIRADVTGVVKSVRFGLDASASFRVESASPYALFGDRGGNDFIDGTFSVGGHTLKATAFAGTGASGVAGAANTVTFTVVNQPVVPPAQNLDVTQFVLINADTDKANSVPF